MMYFKKYSTKQKEIYFKAYLNLSELEIALNRIKEADVFKSQISVLGKVSQYYLDKEMDLSEGIDVIKVYWQKVWGNHVRYGRFFNSEMGNIFIVGSLTSTFLHQVDGKSLATLSSGPYGILRGLGVDESTAIAYLKTLSIGQYLLIIRGFEADIWQLEYVLEENVIQTDT